MTDAIRLRLDDERASVAQLVPVPHSFANAPRDEITEGNIVLIGLRSAGPNERATVDESWLPDMRLEITEAAETLTWDMQVRVYEEVVIRKEGHERLETITATLRHHEAEVRIEGEVTTEGLDLRSGVKGLPNVPRTD